jgi:hypothetical protein
MILKPADLGNILPQLGELLAILCHQKASELRECCALNATKDYQFTQDWFYSQYPDGNGKIADFKLWKSAVFKECRLAGCWIIF